MPLPFGLDSPSSSLPMGIDAVAAASGGIFTDVVEIDGTDYACKVSSPQKIITGRTRDMMATEFGLTDYIVRFPGYIPSITVHTQMIWKTQKGSPLPVHYILIALFGLAPPDPDTDNTWRVKAEWKGATEPATPVDATPGEATVTEGAIVIDGGSRTTDLTVAGDTYTFTDGTTLTYTPDGTPTTLPTDGVFLTWLDGNGNLQVTQ